VIPRPDPPLSRDERLAVLAAAVVALLVLLLAVAV
jgi:hypothetical protein